MCLRRDGDIVQGHAHSQHQKQSAYDDNAAFGNLKLFEDETDDS